jgi:hypothetical protein
MKNKSGTIAGILLIIALTIVFTSCGTSKRSCGGNPIHLGN